MLFYWLKSAVSVLCLPTCFHVEDKLAMEKDIQFGTCTFNVASVRSPMAHAELCCWGQRAILPRRSSHRWLDGESRAPGLMQNWLPIERQVAQTGLTRVAILLFPTLIGGSLHYCCWASVCVFGHFGIPFWVGTESNMDHLSLLWLSLGELSHLSE